MATKNLGTIRAIHIAASPPSNTYMLWYNTGINGYTQYKHHYYDVNESLWKEVAIDTAVILAAIQGLSWKDEVVAATTTNIVISTALNVGDVIDGVTLVAGDRVLVKNQTTQSENGIYIVGAVPARSDDMNLSAEFNNAIVSVQTGGIQNGGTSWRCTAVNPEIGVTSIQFTAFPQNVPSASELVEGILYLATQAEVNAGSDDEKAVTSAKLKVILDVIRESITDLEGEIVETPDASETVKGKIEIANAVEAEEETDDLKAMTPAKVKLLLDPIRTILDLLLPAPPQNLSGLSFTMTLYTALEAGTGTSHNDCTDDTTPDASIADFYDGDIGTLSAEIDSVVSGSRVLTTGDDSGTYTSLVITADEDPYLGEVGKEGFYKQLSATIRAAVALSYATHTYQLKHSVTGNSVLRSFHVDNPGTVTITNISITLPVSNSRYVSGVPSLENGEVILITLRVVNAVGKHYTASNMVVITATGITTLNLNPSVPPVESANVDFTDEEITVSGNDYSEDLTLNIVGYNSKAVAGTPSIEATGARKDQVSNEIGRLKAGEGIYPVADYGTSYDSTISLADVSYDEELQLLNGEYQWPTGDYSGNLPTNGPDYSVLSAVGTRRAIPVGGSVVIVNKTSITVTIQGASGFLNIIESDITLQVKVEGETGWLDANSAYPGAGVPTNDGDACLDVGGSTATVKRITFGPTPRTGTVYVRIGLIDASSKKFTGILIS